MTTTIDRETDMPTAERTMSMAGDEAPEGSLLDGPPGGEALPWWLVSMHGTDLLVA